MNSVETIAFEKNAEGNFLIHLRHGNDTVTYTITSPEDVQDVIYLMPQCLAPDLAAKNMEIGSEVCKISCGEGCEAMNKLSPAQAHAIFRVLAMADNPSDLDVMVQAIQVCMEG